LNPANRRWGRTGNFRPHLVPPNLQMERTAETAKQNGPTQKNIPKKTPRKKHATRANARKRRFEGKTNTRSGTGAASSSGEGRREKWSRAGPTNLGRREVDQGGVSGEQAVSAVRSRSRDSHAAAGDSWGRGGGGARREGRERKRRRGATGERGGGERQREINRN
jgi:hypothetical protein